MALPDHGSTSQVADSVDIGLSPSLTIQALEKSCERKRILRYEALGFFSRYHIDDIHASTCVLAVISQLGTAR